MSSRRLLTVVLTAAFTFAAPADVIFVDDDNCPGPGSGTPGDPYCSIQTAIDNAVDTDEIVVAPGIYLETIDFLGKAVWLHSSGGPDVTIINAQQSGSVVTTDSGEGPGTVLEEFTITAGTGTPVEHPPDSAEFELRGGGMYCRASKPTVTSCTFAGNSAEIGGGMYNDDANPTVTNCSFSGNAASGDTPFRGGGGMYNHQSDPTVSGCTFSGNAATGASIGGGGGMYNFFGSPTVTDCTFSGNSADASQGGGMRNYYGNPTVTGCTFSENRAENGGGMFNDNNSPTVADCTFTDNSADDTYGGGMANINSSPTVTNCTFSGNSAGGSTPPHYFFGFGGGMYNHNFSGDSPVVVACAFSDNWSARGGALYNFYSSPIVTDCTFSGNTAEESGGGMHNDSHSSPAVTNCLFEMNTVNTTSPFTYGGGGMYNYLESSPTLSGCSFSDNQAENGGGMYNRFAGPTVTGCTFTGNAASGDPPYGRGGGMCNYFGNPTVADCTFSGNAANNEGGGMGNLSANPAVTRCMFSSNSASGDAPFGGGGGMYNQGSSPSVTNCMFIDNSAPAGGGGGMYNSGSQCSPAVTNCTFSRNMGFAAMYNRPFCSPTVANCVVWNNGDPDIFADAKATVTVRYSDVGSGWPGPGNIRRDPLFVDPDNGNYRLSPGSPCVDAGDNTAVPDGIDTDLDGNRRFVVGATMLQLTAGPRVDMGAYEYQPHSPVEVLLRVMYGSDAGMVARQFGLRR